MRIARIPTGYRPRPLQAILHRQLQRFNVIVAHRRFGKTVFAINELIDRALRCNLPKPRLAYIAPYRNQAKNIAWDYLKHFSRTIPGSQIHESELRVTLPGDRRISLYGADNFEALRGLYFDAVVLDEFAQMPARLWPEIIRPALADRMGMAVFIGTPKGRDAFYQLYRDSAGRPHWFRALYRASDSGILPDNELTAARSIMTEAQYNQEFECSFDAGQDGSYYAALLSQLELQQRITRVPHDPSLPVITGWDVGMDDATAIWCAQPAGGELRLINFYSARGHGLSHYAQWLQQQPYYYQEHLLPHDMQVRELGTGKSRLESLQKLGLPCRVVPLQRIEDGINAVRLILPRCLIDVERCKEGLEALWHYRVEQNDHNGQNSRPKHDWSSHAADALRYLALGLRNKKPTLPPLPPTNFDPLQW